MNTMLLKSASLITSLSVAAVAILATASAGKATTIAFNFYKEAAPDPTAVQNYYNCSTAPATDPTGYGPLYGTQCNSLPGIITFGGPVSTQNASYNVYNDTPYYESQISYALNTDPTVQFDAANTKSDIFSSITQTSPTNLLLTGGTIAPHSWFKISRIFTNTNGSSMTAYTDSITFSIVPESSPTLSLLAFGIFGVGLLIKRQLS